VDDAMKQKLKKWILFNWDFVVLVFVGVFIFIINWEEIVK